MSDDPSDPNAPLPPNAPMFLRAFYVMVQELIDGSPSADDRETLQKIWDWMVTHVPERLLRP